MLHAPAKPRKSGSVTFDHAFRFVRRVVFRVGPDNRRSGRAFEKIGAVSLGLQTDPRRGQSAVYEITRDAAGPAVSSP
jgi:RimJ/RimL family protein N-acetyltransferase